MSIDNAILATLYACRLHRFIKDGMALCGLGGPKAVKFPARIKNQQSSVGLVKRQKV